MPFPDLQLLAHSAAVEEMERPFRLTDSESSISEDYEDFDDITLETTEPQDLTQEIEAVPAKGTDSTELSDEEFQDCYEEQSQEEEDDEDLDVKIVWLAAVTLFARSHLQHIRLQIRRYVLNVEIIARLIMHYITRNLKIVTGIEMAPLKSIKKKPKLFRDSTSGDSEGDDDAPPNRRKKSPKKKKED